MPVMFLCCYTNVYPLQDNKKKRHVSITASSIHMCCQDQVDAAVKQLLTLKAEYKQVTGQDYKPGAAPVQKTQAPVQKSPAPGAPGAPGAPDTTGLYEKVAEQGEVVRKLKTEKASKVRARVHLFLMFLRP